MRDVRVDLHYTNRKEKIQNPRRRSAQDTPAQNVGLNFCGFIDFTLVQALDGCDGIFVIAPID